MTPDSGPAAGIVVYLTGANLSPGGGWIGTHEADGTYRQVHHAAAASADTWSDATLIALRHADEHGTLDQVTVVWWETLTTLEQHKAATGHVRDAAASLAAQLPLRWRAEGAPDHWPTKISYPTGWHPVRTWEQLTLASTRESNARLRIWYLAATAPYLADGTGPTISGILEVDDDTSLAGALPAYTATLATNRQHLIASAERDHLIPEPAPDHIPTSDQLLQLANHVRWQHHAHHGLTTNTVNLIRQGDVLSVRLAQLAGTDTPIRTILDHDTRQHDEAIATARFNATRATGIHTTEQARRQHRDSIDNTKATRANVYVTLLLAVAAAALTTAQLTDRRQRRTGATLTTAGILTGLGILLIGATPNRYTRAQRSLIAAGLATSATGLGIYQHFATTTCIALGALGAVTGYTLTYLANYVALNNATEPLRRFFGSRR